MLMFSSRRLPRGRLPLGVLLTLLGLAAAGTSALAAPSAHAAGTPALCPASRWIESWYAAPSDADSVADARLHAFVHGPDQTLRMIITPHYGGNLVRVRLSNAFGTTPVTISDVAIAASRSGAALVPGSSRPVRFAGQPSVTIPAGGEAVSDPTAFSFTAFENLAVSMYAPGGELPTEHFTGRQTSYGTLPLAGDHVTDTAATSFTQTTTARYFLDGLDVEAAGNAGTVVTFGDSITDGYQAADAALVPEQTSTLDENARYPDWLARRILAAGVPLSVANAGISGNLILNTGLLPMFGPPGLSRFAADALAVPGVSTIIILEGINDVDSTHATTAAQIIGGLTQLARMAEAAGVRVLLGTLTPSESASALTTATGKAQNATRQAVNDWIRSQQIANGVVDFDHAVADPANPNTIAPGYNGGDSLHFTPAGYHAMADQVDLGQLAGPDCSAGRLTVTVTPRRILTGTRVVIRIRVQARPAGGATSAVTVRLGSHTAVARHGRATIDARFTHPGRYTVRASAPGELPGTATVTVHGRQVAHCAVQRAADEIQCPGNPGMGDPEESGCGGLE